MWKSRLNCTDPDKKSVSHSEGSVCPNGHVMHPSWDICPYCQGMQQALINDQKVQSHDLIDNDGSKLGDIEFDLKCRREREKRETTS